MIANGDKEKQKIVYAVLTYFFGGYVTLGD